ncbi:MAG: insulinase family protein [Bacteroidetes bacterium]|nr:insulinase family protein [Bacteroidota bacterium]
MKRVLSPMMVVVACLAVLLVGTPTMSTAQVDLSKVVQPHGDITIGTLPNGLKYYVKKNGQPKNRLELMLVVNAGAVLEDDDQNGLAHFCEHMAFNGTRFFPKQELVNFLESTGIRFGADLNAYTNQEETVYMLTVPLAGGGTFSKGFEVLRDWARFVTYDDKDIDEERGVVTEEWRLRRGAEERVRKMHNTALFGDSKYVRRDVIGDTAVLAHTPADRLRAFYKTWYRPENMAVIVVGDVDVKDVMPLIEKHFSFSADVSGAQPARPSAVLPSHKETIVSIASDPELQTARVSIYNKRPGRKTATMGDFRRDIVTQLMSSMLSNRLQELTRKATPAFAAAFAGQTSLTRETMAYIVSATAADKNIMKSMNAVLTEIARAQRHGFTQSELDRAKSEMMSRMEAYYNERDKTESSSLAREYMRNYLEGEAIPGIAMEYDIYKRLTPDVTLADVKASIVEFTPNEDRVITVSVPEGNGYTKPTEQDVNALVAAVAAKTIEPWVDAAPVKPLMEKEPVAGSIKDRKELPEVGATMLTLSNGAKVILKKTDFKNDEILLNAWKSGGTSLAPEADIVTADLAAAIVDEGGIASFDANALSKVLQGKNIALSPFINEDREGFTGQTSPKDMKTFMELLHLYFTAPRKDSAGFESLKAKIRTQLENKAKSPEATLFDTITVAWSNNHPRKRPLTIDALEKVSLEKAFAFYKDRFKSAADFTFCFVGNFDEATIEKDLATYVASIPGGPTKETWKDNKIRMPKGAIHKTVYKGKDAKATVVAAFHGPMKYSPATRYDMIALTEVMNIRLREEMREKLSGVYFVQVQPQPSKIPVEEYALSIFFGCAPDRVDEMLAVVKKEAEYLRNNKVDDSYIQKVKEIQTKEREVNLKKNQFWTSAMPKILFEGEPLSVIKERDTFIKNLTAAQVQAAAKAYLDLGTFSTVILKPETK